MADDVPFSFEQIRTAALSLSPSDREALAEELLRSLCDADQVEVDADLLAEVRRRDRDYQMGESIARSVEDVLARLAAKSRQ
jgi:putative addiction module component (TIGR02574 family)